MSASQDSTCESLDQIKQPVTIKSFRKIGADERGMTFELDLLNKRDQFVFLTRHSGTISGNTYHQGTCATTNPKIFLLLSGEIRFSWRKIDEKTPQTTTLSAPCMIEVLPEVTHQVEAITDIILIECNSLADIQQDRIRELVFN